MVSVDEIGRSLPGITADRSRRTCDFGAVEKADSEYECELMIEALKKELSAVRVSKIPCRAFMCIIIWLRLCDTDEDNNLVWTVKAITCK